jgi:uncharacterized protein with von Willebrand factor type A (vWA) domain
VFIFFGQRFRIPGDTIVGLNSSKLYADAGKLKGLLWQVNDRSADGGVSVVMVLDESGSMSGTKIMEAKIHSYFLSRKGTL